MKLLVALSFLLPVFILNSASAEFEPNARQKEVLDLALNGEGTFYHENMFQSRHGDTNDCPVSIHYHRFGSKKGKKGAIFVSTGFTEAALKYTELADDLIKAGYGPIYVINHRGQGSSDRVLVDETSLTCLEQTQLVKDFRVERASGRKTREEAPYDMATRNKGYVEDFKHFADDFADFVNKVIERDGPNGTKIVDVEKMFLLAHSMGGAVAQLYLMRNSNPFSRVILSSPMLKPSTPQIAPEFLGKGFNTFLTRFGSNLGWLAGGIPLVDGLDWTDYATEGAKNSQEWNKYSLFRVFSHEDYMAGTQTYQGTPRNELTSDPSRYWFHINLLDRHPADLPINGPTYGWVHEALDGTERYILGGDWRAFVERNQHNRLAQTSKALKIKIFQAASDSVVVNSRQDTICGKINEPSESGKRVLCEMVKKPFMEKGSKPGENKGSEHEIFIERDIYRNAAIAEIKAHFVVPGAGN